MSESVDVYWSFRSPYSYIATPDLLKLRDDFDVEVSRSKSLQIETGSEADDASSNNSDFHDSILSEFNSQMADALRAEIQS